jgi:hypothetical protein
MNQSTAHSTDAPGLAKVAAAKAAEICEHMELGKDAAALLAEQDPTTFFDLLIARKLYDDALAFLAYGLPKREAVWWSLECAKKIAPAPAPPIAAAFEVVDAWLLEPENDEKRRAAMPAADAATYGTPAGCTALAVFFSGGSIAPADCPGVPPGEWLCARTVASGIQLGTLLVPPPEKEETALTFLTRGIEIANEPAPWDEKPAAPSKAKPTGKAAR